MTKPRSSQVSLEQTPFYHVVNRCVRRAFLCGCDPVSGQSFEHRRAWIEQRLMQLASVFAMDVAAFAIMSNHYHIVLKVDRESALAWSDDEVLRRWTQLFSGTANLQQYLELQRSGEAIPDYLQSHAAEMAEVYRHRLYDLSWFMRILNESIARMANKEEGVKGRFWEGRFKSQAILDEAALMTVMAYVDLNPVRAKLCDEVVSSDHTSIQARLLGRYDKEEIPDVQEADNVEDSAEVVAENAFLHRLQSLPISALLPFDASGHHKNAIPFALPQYVEFVDYMSRAVHPNKRGFIGDDKPSIMRSLGLSDEVIMAFTEGKLLRSFADAIGSQPSLMTLKQRDDRLRVKGRGQARRLFKPSPSVAGDSYE